jgi:hypothetical protein
MEIVEDWKGGIGFDGIMRLDPRKLLAPVVVLAEGF